ncbi:MAG: polysaccharide biosynthesis tyrosine autokinase [Planctomycetes bacterium]|nr:polysaccharide biosynthesis tyrosine autokinase [Planctomycetota bacterium]
MSQQPMPVPTPPMGGLAPADVWRIIKRRLWLIIACFVVLGLGGSGGLVAWFVWAPLYTAEGIIEVEPGQAQMPVLTGAVQPEVPIGLLGPYIEAQVLAIRNYRVLQAALKELEGKQFAYTGGGDVRDLAEDLDARYIPNTQNIYVALRGWDRREVTDIVTQVLTQYTAQLVEDRKQADADRQRELRQERDDLRNQLEALGRRLASLRDESAIIVIDERASEQLARLTTLARQLADAQYKLAEAKAAWDQFQKLRDQAEAGKDMTPVLMVYPKVMEDMRRDAGINAATELVSRLAQDLQGLRARFGPKNEIVLRTETALQTAQNELQAKQSDILGQLFQQTAATLKSDYDRAREAEADLLSRVSEARTAALGVAKLTADYRAREQEYNRVQTLLNTVTDGLERMRIAAALFRPNIRVTRWPLLPIEPSEPRLHLYIPAVLVFSLMVGLGLGLLVEVADTRLRTPSEVARHVGAPLLGSIPDLSEDERLAMDTNLVLVSQTVPHSLLAEAFRQTRTNMLFASDRPVRSLLVTSPSPGDGKTTVAANLALTMARGGNRVLLIEANFRRPCLARALDIPEALGLSNVLVGLAEFQDAVQATKIQNLDVLVCGALPPSPAELLGSRAMRTLIQREVERYDQVIIDGAPILVVADNYLLAEAVDGVVMVLRAGGNTRGLAQRAVRQVRTFRARLLGAVLNRVRATKGGYFRQAYQAYYDYSGAAGPAALPATARGAARTSSSTAVADPPQGGT